MGHARLALLAWQFRRELLLGCLAVVFLGMVGFVSLVAAIVTVPLAGDSQVHLYALAVGEVNGSLGVDLDVRLPMAIDAVRFGQDFRGVTLETARQTAVLFVMGAGVACQAGESPCICRLVGGVTVCTRSPDGRYELLSLDEVMKDLEFTTEERERVWLMVVGVVDRTRESFWLSKPQHFSGS